MKKFITNNKILLFILVIFIIIFSIVIVNRKKPIDANQKYVQDLYAYLGDTNINMCGGLLTYSDKIVTENDISIENKLCNTYRLLDKTEFVKESLEKVKKQEYCEFNENIRFKIDDEKSNNCTITKFSADKIGKMYQNIYNKKIDNYITFKYDTDYKCIYEEKNYFCGLGEEKVITYSTNISDVYRLIESAYTKGNELVIEDYFLRVVDNTYYKSYTKSDSIECEIKNDDNIITNEILESCGTLYKHTFKKINDTYYWLNSKPIEYDKGSK